jgi:hypothetical protein
LRACIRELKRFGHFVTVKRLRKYRDTAAAFPPAQRRPDVSFDVHAAAGIPEMLERAPVELKKMKWPILANGSHGLRPHCVVTMRLCAGFIEISVGKTSGKISA